jgi:hypothetical protein
MQSPRMTTRRWMLAIAVTAVPLAAWDRVVETYNAYRFRKGGIRAMSPARSQRSTDKENG